MPSKYRYTIPKDLKFSDLNVVVSDDEVVSANWPTVARVCEASGIDPEAYRKVMAEELSGLGAYWYRRSRAAGEPPHPFYESVYRELAAETASRLDPVYDKSDRVELRRLRMSEPRTSLKQRWEILQREVPKIASSRLGFVPNLFSRNWTFVTDAQASLVYTVGLYYFYGRDELLIKAPGRSPADIAGVLQQLCVYVGTLDRSIAPREPVELRDFGTELTFTPMTEQAFQTYPCGYLATFEKYFNDIRNPKEGSLPVMVTELPAGETIGKEASRADTRGGLAGILRRFVQRK